MIPDELRARCKKLVTHIHGCRPDGQARADYIESYVQGAFEQNISFSWEEEK